MAIIGNIPYFQTNPFDGKNIWLLGKFPTTQLMASQGPHVTLTPVLAQLAHANFAVHVSVPALLVPAHVDGGQNRKWANAAFRANHDVP